MEITVEFLTEIDKLVQLIESPIFACKYIKHINKKILKKQIFLTALRLTLVSQKNDNADAQHLAQALFGILMLLPQTDAFNLLKNRLQCVPNYWGRSIDKNSSKSIESQSSVDFTILLKHFEQIQQIHQQQRIAQRKKNVSLQEQKNL